MDDVLLCWIRFTRPRNILLPSLKGCSNRMNARNELSILPEFIKRRFAHPCHDAHVGDHIGRVSNLDSDFANRGIQGSHREGNDIHRAPFHRALKHRSQLWLHLSRVSPIVCWPSLLFGFRADVSAVFDSRYIAWMRPSQETTRPRLFIQTSKHSP